MKFSLKLHIIINTHDINNIIYAMYLYLLNKCALFYEILILTFKHYSTSNKNINVEVKKKHISAQVDNHKVVLQVPFNVQSVNYPSFHHDYVL